MKRNDVEFILDRIGELTEEHVSMSVSEWAEKNRFLPSELSNLPGQYDYSVTPYLREIADNFSPFSPVRETACMKATQLGLTTGVLENVIGYHIDCNPSPIIFMTADQEMAKDAMDVKVARMLSTSNLTKKIFSQSTIIDKSSKKTGDKVLRKEFVGGSLLAVGSRSGGKLRSNTAKILLCDEVDAMVDQVGRDGCPLVVAKKRTDTFARNRKIFYNSTPLEKYTSKIQRYYYKGDRRKYYVPCKNKKCKKLQELHFKPETIVDDDGNEIKRGGLVWEKNEKGNVDYSTVRYACKYCDSLWTNNDKAYFLRDKKCGGPAKWVPTNEDHDDPTYRSYHISSLYSPVGMFAWEDVVKEFQDAKKDRVTMKAFENTVLGIPASEETRAIKIRDFVENRKEYLAGTVPKPVVFLTASVDVHHNDLSVELVGWSRYEVAFSIKWTVLVGDTSSLKNDVWKELRKLLTTKFEGKSIRGVFVDSGDGDRQQQVYGFCDSFSRGVWAIKGGSHKSFDNFQVKKRTDNSGKEYVNINTDYYKDKFIELFSYKEEDDGSFPVGYCAYPKDYKDSYFKQYTGETKRQKVNSDGTPGAWIWHRTRANHALDCRVYNMCLHDFMYTMYAKTYGGEVTWDDFYDFYDENKKDPS